MYIVIPYLVSVTLVVIAYFLGWSSNVSNFEKILDAVITFTSIIIGFLGALLGILFTVKDTEIVKELFKKHRSAMKYFFNEALITGFLLILLSAVFYIYKDNTSEYVKYMFCAWIGFVSLFVTSSYRVITSLMSLLFNSDKKKEINDFSEDQKEAIEKRKAALTKKSE